MQEQNLQTSYPGHSVSKCWLCSVPNSKGQSGLLAHWINSHIGCLYLITKLMQHLQFQLPAGAYPKRQQKMAEVLVLLLLVWESIEFQAPGLGIELVASVSLSLNFK